MGRLTSFETQNLDCESKDGKRIFGKCNAIEILDFYKFKMT